MNLMPSFFFSCCYSLVALWNISIFAQKIAPEHEAIFTKIYDEATWGTNEEGLGFSGGGSLLNNTLPYIHFLQEFMQSHDIQTVVDVGCGDWEFSRYVDWSKVNYIGYDIVSSVIQKNKKKYTSPHISFIHANFLNTDLPSADLLLCKHVLQHLSNEDISKFLEQVQKFQYCLITNQVELDTLSGDNAEIPTGACHKVDLSESPFFVKGTKIFTYFHDGSAHQVFLIDKNQ